jgi:hypothetical protein
LVLGGRDVKPCLAACECASTVGVASPNTPAALWGTMEP